MTRREFQFIDGASKKFWAIQLDGKTFTVHYGRIGTTGQAQEKSFGDEATAQRESDKLISEKTKKGYAEVAPGASGALPPPVAKVAVALEKPAAKPAPVTAPLPLQTPVPAVASAAPSAPTAKTEPASASVSTPSVPPTLERSIKLSADDRLFVTWAVHETRPKPAPVPFNLEDCLTRLRSIGDTKYDWQQDWEKAKIPKFPSPQEAQFWLLAQRDCRSRKVLLSAAANSLEKTTLEGRMSVDEVKEATQQIWREPKNLLACVAALFSPQKFASLDWLGRANAGAAPAEGFRASVLPYLTAQERSELKQDFAVRFTPVQPANDYTSWPSYYFIGALLGCHEEMLAVLRALPDGRYVEGNGNGRPDYHHTPQWLVFGLADAKTVASEARRLGIKMRTPEQARAWLALTEYSALDVLALSVCAATSKEEAAKLAGALQLVTAPEAAIPALEITLSSKAPHAGYEWLNGRLLHAVVGLVPAAMAQGKLAEAAREYLRTMRRGAQASSLVAALPHLPPDQAAWLQREILESTEETLTEISREELPETLQSAFAEIKTAKPPGWLTVAALPMLKLKGQKLGAAEIETILNALKTTPLGAPSALFSALKDHTEANSRDAFAWKVFDLWHSMGAPSKDKWAMGAIGHLGGDACVLNLTPLVREWPGQSQHQRAVYGLECLRAVGSDTALMALNGIALKLKFKGLKEKAQTLMEAIANARGFTREQLADRIVPDCGLDERGSRIFDFGPRQFRFVLGSEMKPLVRDAAGKVRPDLPAPNSSDDREKAEAAVAEWKLLKKTLREVLKVQAERLEDAMITGRRWTPEEFQTLLVNHPLMVNLVRQLVFAVYDDAGNATQSFRVTEDQSLADQNDDPIDAPAAGRIGIVHPAHFAEDAKGAWGQVLSDYEIIPPFQQLGRAICRAEADDLEKTEITRYRGPKVPGIVMYGMLERSHWLRDTPADGGGFVQHSKYFPAANLTAFIQYDGMSIGYYEEKQELQAVYFAPGHLEPEMWGRHQKRLKIKDVDAVVLSEVLRLANAIISKAE